MQELVIARSGDRTFGIPSSEVAEIFAPRAVTPLPEPVPHFAGTLFRMGRLITIVDASSLISGQGMGNETPRLLARLGAPKENIAFAVDAVDAVVPYNELDLKDEASGELWSGLYPMGEQWVSVLNVKAACAMLESAVADGQAWGRSQRRINAG